MEFVNNDASGRVLHNASRRKLNRKKCMYSTEFLATSTTKPLDFREARNI